ncbi:MAG: M48 family metalloprotease [Candidatus Heimdallarchaeota archaeon]
MSDQDFAELNAILRDLEPKVYQAGIKVEIKEKRKFGARANNLRSKIDVGKELFDATAPQERKAVLAHEIGHISLNPSLRLGWRSWLPGPYTIFPLIAFFLIASAIWSFLDHPTWTWYFLSLILFFLAIWNGEYNHLQAELQADLLAAILINSPQKHKEVLEKLFSIKLEKFSQRGIFYRFRKLPKLYLAKREIKIRLQHLEKLIETKKALTSQL